MDHTLAINHLGGIGALRSMLGVKTVVTSEDAISFQFKGSRKHKYAHVTFLATDMYELKLIDRRGATVSTHECYCDNLREVFEHETGLLLSLS